jgi:UDP-N-acetylmuramoyl-L-alanyl-D-glutamate--2,6-diaminopimelate ligase
MDLTPLVKDGILIPLGSEDYRPTSLSINSRSIEKGGLFIAIPGSQHDGTAFIDEALRRGASGIVAPLEVGEKIAFHFKGQYPVVSFFGTPDVRKAASRLASSFYPFQPNNIVAVTGTSGKTSVVSFLRQIWHHLGLPAASLGTLGLIVEGRPLPPPTGTEGINTPNPVRLHQILHTLKEEQIDHLAFEASSHGLHQHRLDSVRLRAAIFTNFSNDHLDYHHTIDAYFEAKVRLFQEIMIHGSCAILNTDMAEFERLLSLCQDRRLKTITFGKAGEMIRLISIIPKEGCQDVFWSIEGKPYNFTLPLVGQFQVYNVMAAVGAVIACGGDITQAIDACVNLKGVPGRLEQAAPNIYVDYSHKPDALSMALQSLRHHTKGKLCVVFGCGGNRDSFKRPMMGEIAAKFADKVIVTDDNPRYENPADIRKQILAKCPGASEIPSRSVAIAKAIEERQPGDVILIAGKGHETYQLVGDQVLPFSDVEEVQKCVRR